ncbi:uncharacterized protein Tco025E_05139 [Trypanosoma conorhini]|uniref:Uncharacterized protein n=1 Tax=Trypanosoma conorhini TaxID=83891 RepID=A0A422PG25_9TRYP|nr:uncharacterized protein Tco025E_05139 [Trypanosoma conorhini]RNF16670.1 hypothetical protein Tco025E_05139 [Trypanosoma conorhini]
MIIRLIGDSWVPEDKLLISVREDSEIKASLPNIMKKLLIKRIGEYKLYYTIGERKCDYARLIDTYSTWKELGISGGSVIYLSKKEPSVMEESTTAMDVSKDKEEDERPPRMNVLATQESAPILPPSVSIVATEVVPDKKLPTHSQQESSPIHIPTPDASPIQLGSSPQVKNVSLPILPCSGKDEIDFVGSDSTYGNPNTATQSCRSQPNLTSVLQKTQCHVNKSEVAGLSLAPEVLHPSFYESRATASPLPEKYPADRAKREVVLGRCERTAYVVSLYEFAHLELQRQRRRAEQLRSEPQRGLLRSSTSQPQLLYKI